MEEKKCVYCGKDIEIGRNKYCSKECAKKSQNEKMKQWRLNNKEKMLEWKEKNKDKQQQYMREYMKDYYKDPDRKNKHNKKMKEYRILKKGQNSNE